MRIQRLDLLRYGRFTDTHLALPMSSSDFHMVFGPNEAGKSTALSAIEDLLFGIASNSPYNFLHDYGSMRIGAVLESAGKTLEVRRRKGIKDTLLTPSEVPITGGAGALASYLAGTDQSFFTRMFSLDHERLRKGGREILEAQDEVGQMLFSAGAGLSGLRDQLKGLNNEADGLWASRRAAHRKYYQVLDSFDGAERALREHTVTASHWQEVKRAYDDAQEAYAGLERQHEAICCELRKLSRIRRVYRDIRKLVALDEEIKVLGKIIPLPENAASDLDSAEREQWDAKTRINTLKEQLDSEQRQREALQCDKEFLIREDDIQQFHKRRIEVQKEKTDLPRRLAELASAEVNLQRLADELEWKTDGLDTLVNRIPPRAKITALRTLLSRHGERMSGVINSKSSVDELESQIADVQQELDGLGTPVDVSQLAAVLIATRKSSGIALRIQTAEAEAREAEAAIEHRLLCLKPQVKDTEALLSITVPSRDTIQNHRDDLRNSDQHMQVCRERIRTAEQELARHLKAQERLAHDEAAVAPQDLVAARNSRDSGWSLIRRRFIEGIAVSEEELHAYTGSGTDLPHTYESAVSTADALADRRFENAQAAAQIAMTARQIAEQQELLEGLCKEEDVLSKHIGALEFSWKDLWADAPFEPLSPDLMQIWLESRNEILELIKRKGTAERQLEALREEELRAKGRIVAEVIAITGKPSSLGDHPLSIVMESAGAVQIQHERVATNRRQLEQRLLKMKADVARKAKAFTMADEAWASWKTEWTAALQVVGLAIGTMPEAATTQLDCIDQMREIAVKIHELRHKRIEKIEKDIEVFTADVSGLVTIIARDLQKLSPEDAVLELERRLETAKRIHEEQENKNESIAALIKKIDECEASGREARETIQYLQKAAAVEDLDKLKSAILNSDRLREHEGERSRLMSTLLKEGDGLSPNELKMECEAADIDQVTTREQTLDQDLTELRERLTEAAEHRTRTRNAFEAIGGENRAAQAAADRQSALAEMRDVVERYIQVRSSATLLQWAIERYRREKQGPLLKRAGQIFATLTGGSFSDLRVEFDEQDRAQLAGVRPNGGLVRVPGMSTGTADQLYLALRVASIEDYLNRADAIPFVADDLFINFDDDRAAAGFKVLGELALKTQVLFFTHHQHLVEIAQATLGPSVTVASL